MIPFYCTQCGTKQKDGAAYCHACGVPSEYSSHTRWYAYHYEVAANTPARPKHLPFSCILAYIPTLFWLPLATNPQDKTHRICANQGLLLTITSVIFGLGLVLGGTYLHQAGIVDFTTIEQFYTDWTYTNWVERLPTAWVYMAVMPFALFAPINSICGFFNGMASEIPYRIPLIGRIRLIKEESHDTKA